MPGISRSRVGLSTTSTHREGIPGPFHELSFPPTRYQGSKRKIARAIVQALAPFDYHTVLDAFGGSGAVAYAFKQAGKAVTYNDLLEFNRQIGLALIENTAVRWSPMDAANLGRRRRGVVYGDFIARTFEGIYYTTEENHWLDRAVANVRAIADRFQRAVAWFALFQAAIAKRPYNLFHRRNLYMRLSDVPRSFGNKSSWDRGFDEHVALFASQASAAVFDSGVPCRAIRGDVLQLAGDFDLVYIDPPYINRNGVGVDYRDFYHFLEGMVRYEDWPGGIDRDSKHLRLARLADPWSDPRACHGLYRTLFDRFRGAVLAVSYRSDGIPSITELKNMLRTVKKKVRVISGPRQPYALSTRRDTRQVLLVAEG